MTIPLLLAQFSNLAYNDNQDFPGYQSILIDKKGSQAYFLFNIDTIIIVCRGTQVTEWQDIVADIRFKLVTSSSGIGKVHKGFKASVDHVWDDIVKLLKKYKVGIIGIGATSKLVIVDRNLSIIDSKSISNLRITSTSIVQPIFNDAATTAQKNTYGPTTTLRITGIKTV